MRMLPVAEIRSSRWTPRPPHGLAGAAFWLSLWFVTLWLVGLVPRFSAPLLGWMQVLVGVLLVGVLIPLSIRYVRTRVLWSVRSKLIVTYLLIGLAPVVLFVTLVGISAYIAAGQFSVHLADTRVRQELESLGSQDEALANRIVRILRLQAHGELGPPPPGRGPGRPGGRPGERPAEPPTAPAATDTTAPQALGESFPNPLRARLHPRTTLYLNGAPLTAGLGPPGLVPPTNPTTGVPLGLPAWASDLKGRQFRGLVVDGDELFLVAMDQRRIDASGPLLTAITSLPVDSALVDLVAEGLGRVRLAAVMTNHRSTSVGSTAAEGTARRRSLGTDLQRTSTSGGTEPGAVNLGDQRVSFVSTMDITDWDTGQPDNVPIEVHSRPSLLYRQLFGSSLGGIVTDYIRIGLLVLCGLFALIQALALWSAVRLSASITASVAELYQGTRHVDQGELTHRIPPPIATEPDQLGELARSFNRMTGSLERLLIEQKEKERLQSEITIAQEVQANLFPHHARNLAELELHGICRPARSVSGDYYDFLVFHHRDPEVDQSALHASNGHAKESGLGIVLGDISGKGISAALLMATLHSAVRAYRFASEDLVYSDHSYSGIVLTRDGDEMPGYTGKLFQSPARILRLLNRHLYRSTQPEKYATLFLGHYDVATAQLTYSNAGHLPPLVLSKDGRVRRLEAGGTVVGLMDGMSYDEGHIQMNSGDILVAYSDGVTEPENDFGDFGETRLMEVVARYRDQPLHVISAQVMLALDAWIGAAEQPDDITLVLARQS